MLNEILSKLSTANPYGGLGSVAERWGIHPLCAAALVTIDVMLFGGEAMSGGLLVLLSALVGMALVVPCTLVQHYAYKDGWLLSWSKGLLLGILTGIPTPLPSALTIALGVSGVIGLRHRASRANVIDIQN
jgi:hypothetical protein